MAKSYSISKLISICTFLVAFFTAVIGALLIKTAFSQTLVIITVLAGCIAVTMCPAVAVICLSDSTPDPPSVPPALDDPPPPYRHTWGREYHKHTTTGGDREPEGDPKTIWTTSNDLSSGASGMEWSAQVPGVHTLASGGVPVAHCRCHKRPCMYSYYNEVAGEERDVPPSRPRDLCDNQGLPSYQDVTNGI